MNVSKTTEINFIISQLKVLSGTEFQKGCKIILRNYWTSKGIGFDMPNPGGGDMKNDGFCSSLSIYYQIYSPEEIRTTFRNDLYEKFIGDFNGLSDLVYTQKKWTGNIKKFIFIVNTKEHFVPEDSDNCVSKTKKEIEDKYKTSIDSAIIVSCDYLYDLLYEMNDEFVDKVFGEFRYEGYYDLLHLSCKDFIDFFNVISAQSISTIFSHKKSSSYIKKSSDEKIEINSIIKYRDEIENTIPFLYLVEEAIEKANSNKDLFTKFLNCKDAFINAYLDNASSCSGDDLYEKIKTHFLSLSKEMRKYELVIILLLVYFFDMCDIFKKD